MSIGVVKRQIKPLSIRRSVASPNIQSLNNNLVRQTSDSTVLFNTLKLVNVRFLRQTSDCSPNVRCKRQNLSPNVRCLLQTSEKERGMRFFSLNESSRFKLSAGRSSCIDCVLCKQKQLGTVVFSSFLYCTLTRGVKKQASQAHNLYATNKFKLSQEDDVFGVRRY